MNKEPARKQIAQQVRSMSETQKRDASSRICEQLRSVASVHFADTILSYLPQKNEISLLPIMQGWIDESRTVAVPATNWENNTMRAGLITSLDSNELVETKYGVKEPLHRHVIPTEYIDVVLVPGVGFDKTGARLGKGGGYYDRFLGLVRPPVVLGIAFDEQIVDAIPFEKHDQFMTAVVTPTRILLM
ncbi:MAG: 5-formyltetrahydrofolate cyclo-ligase [Phycisphaerales bacterium]|jgi:5-formyltetrahydrofolate cyclo-ligase